MPDFTYMNFYACQDINNYVTKIHGNTGIHTVRYDNGKWSCTCDGFKFRKTCKHVRQADKCDWCQEWDGGEPKIIDGDKKCPKCGGEIFIYKSAV